VSVNLPYDNPTGSHPFQWHIINMTHEVKEPRKKTRDNGKCSRLLHYYLSFDE
jgi:hypothetical protein